MNIRVAIFVILSGIMCLFTFGFSIYIGLDLYRYDQLNPEDIISIQANDVTYTIKNRNYTSSVDIYEKHICCKYDPSDPSKLYSVNEDRELTLFILPAVSLLFGFICFVGIKYPDKLAPWIADWISP